MYRKNPTLAWHFFSLSCLLYSIKQIRLELFCEKTFNYTLFKFRYYFPDKLAMILKHAVYDMKQKQERIKRYPLLAKNRDDVISPIILDFIGDTMNKTLFYIIIIW